MPMLTFQLCASSPLINFTREFELSSKHNAMCSHSPKLTGWKFISLGTYVQPMLNSFPGFLMSHPWLLFPKVFLPIKCQ